MLNARVNETEPEYWDLLHAEVFDQGTHQSSALPITYLNIEVDRRSAFARRLLFILRNLAVHLACKERTVPNSLAQFLLPLALHTFLSSCPGLSIISNA